MRTRALLPALAALLLAAGCYYETKLQPIPPARITESGQAVAEEQGVRLVAHGDAWRFHPSDLELALTPVAIRVDNQSGRPLRLEPENFKLVGGSSRFEYAALSPLELQDEGLAVGGSGAPAGHVSLSVGVGVGFGAWGPGPWGPWPYASGYWGGPWGRGWYDPFYYPWGSFYGYGGPYATYGYWIPPEPLPTRDMVKQALPEGTLENGGTVVGFLYFQPVGEREGKVFLQARLVDARTGEQFGTISIPFGVHT